MSSTYYRDRDRDWDTRSHGGGDRPRNTTVRRYVINEDDDDDRYESKTKLKVTTREGERSRSNVREYYERDHDHRDSRETVYRRETSPDQYREIRITRDMSPRDPEPRSPPYELERVTRSTEYFREPERQQPIYIRTEAPPPIIIREQAPQQIVIRDRSSDPPRHEERREESRSEYESQRQVARRDPSSDQDEDYYYERRVRRIERRDEEQDREPDRRSRRDHSDDDEEYYYRKTTDGYGSDPDMHGPDHRRHLAEGAIAGGAIAGLMRHRRKKNGQDHSGKAAGAGQVAGGAALGALAAEGISRVRSHYRSKSRPRSAIGDDDDRGRRDRDDGSRSRSRSHSGPNRKDLAKLGAIAAIGAVAGYAASKRGKKGGADDRRSRSRRRRGSRDRSLSSEGSGSDHKKGGNKATIAGAGLASAAVAGIVEHVRNKSKGPGRSKSKTRAAIPIAAAGLGGAALAGLYERNKEQKRERERQARSRSRSRSVARRGSPTYEAARGDQNLIEYRSGNYYEGRNRRGSSASISPARRLRSRSRGAEDMDEAGQGAYAAHQRRERRRAERAQRQQEEDRNDTPHGMPAPAYGFGPYAEPMPEQNAAAPQYAPNQYYPQNNSFPPPPQNAYSPTPNIVNHETPYHPADFPQNPPYVPPPHAPEPYYPQQGPQPPYNGGDPGYRGNVSSYIPERYVPVADDAVNPTPSPDHELRRRKSVQFNLSPSEHDAPITPTTTNSRETASEQHRGNGDGRREGNNPGEERRQDRSDDQDPESTDADERRETNRSDRATRRRRRHSADAAPERSRRSRRDREDDSRRSKRRARSHSPASDDSGDTVILPDRFDQDGRKKPERGEDPFSDTLQDLLHGKGRMGRWLQRFTDPGSESGGSRRR